MKRITNRLLLIICTGMLMFTGCAKQQVVKKDEQPAPAITKSVQSPTGKPESPAGMANGKAVTATDVTSDVGARKQAAPADGRSLETIYFDFDSSALDDTARQTLSRNFETMKKDSLVKIRIEGHCDERGSDEYNLALGERRAQAALDYLVTLGIPAGRLSYLSYGKEKPFDLNHNEAAWAKNRRDDFMMVSK